MPPVDAGGSSYSYSVKACMSVNMVKQWFRELVLNNASVWDQVIEKFIVQNFGTKAEIIKFNKSELEGKTVSK